MRAILQELGRAALATIALAVIVSGVYPVVVWAVAQTVYPDQANGSLLVKGGAVVGSKLIGQNFTAPQYFHPRPSAAGTGYDPTSSGGSNLGPTSKALIDAVTQRVADYRTENGLSADVPIPADAVTASGSGLDPHISPANARLQAPRVAKARKLPPETVETLIAAHTEYQGAPILGDPAVNVLTLNLALDGANGRQ